VDGYLEKLSMVQDLFDEADAKAEEIATKEELLGEI
jgi:hypothetical protein